MAKKSKLIYLVEDDAYLAPAIQSGLEDIGCKAKCFSNGDSIFKGGLPVPDAVIVDLHIPYVASKGRAPIGNGIEILRKLRTIWKKASLILLTGMPSLDAKEWCERNSVTYCIKPISHRKLESLLGLRPIKAFVVHGRNEAARDKTVSALKASSIEACVLMEQPNKGRTVIEKFEEVADQCDCAVVVWTSDDFGGLSLSNALPSPNPRARQNVVFELGYFYGALRRTTGRVIVLEFGDTELPSDISGVIRIDARKSVTKIAADLKTELS